MKKGITYPALGFGIGLRSVHYEYILENHPAVDWFEFITEDFFVPGGRPLYNLEKIRERYPLVMHGVSMSIGTIDPINWEYMHQLKALAERISPAWISDHFCFTGVDGINMHDLLPLPYTEECLKHLITRIGQVQDFLGRRITLENPSSYISYDASTMTEWEFIATVAKEADCLLLLDVNNVYVSAFNHNFDAITYLNHIPKERVQQFHVAGHSHCGEHIIDTHDHPIISDVWQLYQEAVKRFGPVSTLLERDDNIPEFPVLQEELEQARVFANEVLTNDLFAEVG